MPISRSSIGRATLAFGLLVAVGSAQTLPPEAQAKVQAKAKQTPLSVLDPSVRAFSKNALGQHLKAKQDPQITECFVSGADGTKVAFLAKTTFWSHKDKDKHKVPMTGKVYIGPAQLDDSTGLLEVQVGLPVLDGAKPIGSIVIGLGVSKL